MLNFAIKNGHKSDGTKVGAIKVDHPGPDGGCTVCFQSLWLL